MNTQHTPGPWLLSDNRSAEYQADSYVIRAEFPAKEDDDKFTATVATVRMQSATIAGQYAEANARLIAAAPELFDMLREFAAEDSQCRSDWLDLKRSARALIAKVEGTPKPYGVLHITNTDRRAFDSVEGPQ